MGREGKGPASLSQPIKLNRVWLRRRWHKGVERYVDHLAIGPIVVGRKLRNRWVLARFGWLAHGTAKSIAYPL